MQFTTPVPISKNVFPIDYDSKIVSLGSCFAVNMAAKLDYYKFQNTVNPFGILFHPLAIGELLRRAVQEDFYTESDLFFHNERWHCFDAHSDLSTIDAGALLQNLNQKLTDLKKQLESTTLIIITYGTAWVYREKSSQKIVANCHKLPQTHFEKQLLSIDQIEKAIADTLGFLAQINPKAAVTFTVSPVRHLKDGFVKNQRSKAHLIAAIHEQLVTNHQQLAMVNYFPSYEIMMDELRDYRFYDTDMIHPNATAIDYIWERFVVAYIDPKALPTMEAVCQIQKAMAHRPFNADSESHRKFLQQLQVQKSTLQNQFPHLQF
ncbi:GSCFA domain-containing protein [Flavobacterium sp. CYK-4]|uniref:GSCFA domain-containing protein n=1 Tax=Flavobacterium lotistagni TaxID=2709660 RepID=UPI00140E0869|nr:GSCFA domain-containing protein [Flavobacterium lotistagni]NHM05666.1 GSCFA domain-containing protein [Flavobacterium lotistagni]